MLIPHNEELERIVIGVTIIDEVVPWDAKQLSVTDFYIGLHRAIWSAICELDEDGEKITVTSIFPKLAKWPVKMHELAQMASGLPHHYVCEKEVKELKTLTALRTLQKGFSQLAEKAEAREPVDKLLEHAEGIISAVKDDQAQDAGTSRALADVYERDVFPRLDRFVDGEMVKIPFGWQPLDIATNGGAAVGELVVLGAKPKSGKSALMLQIARTQAERNIGCYVCSREMLNFENGFRALAQSSEYSVNHFKAGLYAETARRLKDHARKSGNIPLHFDDKAKTVRDIRKELDRLEGTGNVITSVFVDYVQLMRTNKRTDTKAEQIEEIIYDLKDLAIEREMVVYANAQFNRDGIDAQRPKMSDFKGSSAIEMAANIVLLWTLEQDADVDRARRGELWLEAGRNVAYDEFKIRFYGEKALFTFAE